MATLLIFVRHGESEGNKAERFNGHSDFKLTEKGRQQAQKTAEYLDKYKIDKVYSSDLKRALQDRFGVSYSTADRIARTEISHIQNTAAKQRYEDYGIREFQVWADKDERRCDVCGKLHKKKFNVNEAPPVPVHPNCRCSIIPVVE